MYVALWYKHGKPIHGRSWNNGGVVECSFPYKKAELRTAQQLEGNIQVLQYSGDHNTQGFWYEWILYKDRFDKAEGRQLLHCGDSFPILWKDRPEVKITRASVYCERCTPKRIWDPFQHVQAGEAA
ncbi:hypothetical protein COOONC_23063 [Cooperia oncophora]